MKLMNYITVITTIKEILSCIEWACVHGRLTINIAARRKKHKKSEAL